MSQSAGGEDEEPTSRKKAFFSRFKSPTKPEKKAEPPIDCVKVEIAPVSRVTSGFLASRRGTETRALNNDPSVGKKTSVVDSAIYVPIVSDVIHASSDESQDEEAPRSALEYYDRCTVACARYKACLNKYMGASDKAALPESNGLDKLATIEDVERALVSACDYLETVQRKREDLRKGKDMAGRLRGAFSGFRKQAKNVQSFLSLLPASSEFASVICGGLSVLLKAAESYEILEQTFHLALREIKIALVDKAYIDEMHPPDARMHGFISDLFASIFGILELLVEWVLQRTLSRVGKAVMTHETYTDKLTGRVEEMKLCADSLRKYGQHRQNLILERTLNLGFSTTTDEVRIVGKKVEDLQNLLEKLAMPLAKARVEESFHQLCVSLLNGGTFPASSAIVRGLRLGGGRKPRPKSVDVDVNSFLGPLRKRLKLTTKDAENIARGTILSRDDQKTFSELSQHVRLRSFLQTDRSHVMLLEGGSSGGRTTGRSPITLLSAKLFSACQTMRSTEGRFIFAVGYFCSEHRVHKADGTALDMIINMTLQLIEQRQTIDSALLADFQQKLVSKQRNIRDVCSIFAACAAALPPYSTLFVLIEGLGRWEDVSSRVTDTSTILAMLLELGRAEPGDDGSSAKVKCLFTTPTRTIKYKGLFEPFEVFTCHDRLGSSTLMSSPGRQLRG